MLKTDTRIATNGERAQQDVEERRHALLDGVLVLLRDLRAGDGLGVRREYLLDPLRELVL